MFFCCGLFEVNTVSLILLRLSKLGRKKQQKKNQHFNTYANFLARPTSVRSLNTLYKWRLTLFQSNRSTIQSANLGCLTPAKSKKLTCVTIFSAYFHLFVSFLPSRELIFLSLLMFPRCLGQTIINITEKKTSALHMFHLSSTSSEITVTFGYFHLPLVALGHEALCFPQRF